MAKVGTYEQLRNKSDEELILLFDAITKNTEVGLGFLRDELARRESERQYERMLNLTRQMRWMTIFITVLTAVNVIVVLAALVW
jgi:hypothetical protein